MISHPLLPQKRPHRPRAKGGVLKLLLLLNRQTLHISLQRLPREGGVEEEMQQLLIREDLEQEPSLLFKGYWKIGSLTHDRHSCSFFTRQNRWVYVYIRLGLLGGWMVKRMQIT